MDIQNLAWLKIALITFREGVEVALLLGIMMAVTQKVQNSRIYIITGVMLGVITAFLFAFFTKSISLSLSGVGDEIFNSAVILLTVFMICCTIVWMRSFVQETKLDLNEASVEINKGYTSRFVLISMVATTILREGVEIMLLIYSIASIQPVDMDSYLLGLAIGAMTGLLFGILIYWGLLQLTGKYVFKVSSIFLAFIAAGLAAEAASILTSSGIIDVFVDEVWDSSWLIDDKSIAGRLLNTAIGYYARPNGMQLIFYCTTLCVITIASILRDALYKNSSSTKLIFANIKIAIKFLTELGPLLAFLIGYFKDGGGIQDATLYMMIVYSIGISACYAMEGTISKASLFSFLTLFILGGVTLISGDSMFIKIKATIGYIVLAAICLFTTIKNRPAVKYLLGTALPFLSDKSWSILSYRITAFLVGMAILNEVVWRNFDESFWVKFKIFGAIPLALLFMALQAPFILRNKIDTTNTVDNLD